MFFSRRSALFIASLSIALLACSRLSAASLYIGDSASAGYHITSGLADGAGQADTANPLTYVFTGTGSTYTALTTTALRLSEVNFIADEGPGQLIPFVAVYNTAAGNNLGSSYRVLAIGDAISVGTGVFAGGGYVVNASFTVGGVAPTIALNAGETLVAGLFQNSRIVLVNPVVPGSNNDYIANANRLPATVGLALTGDSGYNLNRTLRYNIGFDVVPEPSVAGLSLLGLGSILLRRRRG